MLLDFDTEENYYFEDSDGFPYVYDLFILSKVLKENCADKYYQHFTKL